MLAAQKHAAELTDKLGTEQKATETLRTKLEQANAVLQQAEQPYGYLIESLRKVCACGSVIV